MTTYESLLESLAEFDPEDWNIETKCYFLGDIDRRRTEGKLTDEEHKKIRAMVPFKPGEEEKINW